MSQINNGGPAFPIAASEYGGHGTHEGLTMRDYFAAHAPTPVAPMSLDNHCAYRYRYADAMIAAREKGVSP